jgi:RNA polymerase sigma factor (sigma-70 family)
MVLLLEKYATYDDQALLTAISREGDREAFTAFYRRYAEKVYRNMLLFVKEPSEAEDAVQELFARLWQKRTQLNITTNVKGYLNSACRNMAFNRLRDAGKDKRLLISLQTIAADNYQDGSAIEQETLVSEQWALLQRAIDNLPPQRKRVFELCKIKGIAYDQACIELGIGLPTLKDHLFKAKKSIRAYLDGQGEAAFVLLILLGLLAEQDLPSVYPL